MAWSEGLPYIFDTQKREEKIIVPPVLKLRHAEVVLVKDDSIYGRNSEWRAFVPYRIVRVWCFFPEKTLGGWRALLLLWSDSGAVIVCRSSASGCVGT